MKHKFKKDKHLEKIINLIKENILLLDHLNIDELESINDYLNDYEIYLKKEAGDL